VEQLLNEQENRERGEHAREGGRESQCGFRLDEAETETWRDVVPLVRSTWDNSAQHWDID
jgi:hypothetical protein